MSLIIEEQQLEEIIKHCRDEFPLEACGVLGGSDSRVRKVYSLTNTDQSPVSYFIEPRELFNVVKELRDEGWEIIGIYHSHVATEAYPSQRDINTATYPDAVYVILSLSDFQKPEYAAFLLSEAKVQAVPLEIVSEHSVD